MAWQMPLHSVPGFLHLLLFLLVLSVGTSSADDRTIDGTGNNAASFMMGAAHQMIPRLGPARYADGISVPMSAANAELPNPRTLSNVLSDQTGINLDEHGLTDMVWLWGQFIDHDIVLTEGGFEFNPIPIPMGDPDFDPLQTGTNMIPFTRSMPAAGTGMSADMPRHHININTAFIDASTVYGSSEDLADELRAFVDGKLKLTADGLLPRNTNDFPIANDSNIVSADELFLAGDDRVNEHAGLTAIHTLWVREHNRLCDEFKAANPSWTDEELYQRARKWVGALVQVITYREWLPALLGPYSPGSAGTYDPSIDPRASTEFATAFFRVGHTMLGSNLERFGADNFPAPGGHLLLRDAFFDPGRVATGEEILFLLKGFAARPMQQIDMQVIDDVRNFLFGPPGSGGFDLSSLNVQRGRDHGLPDYNTMRAHFGLPPRDFTGINTNNPGIGADLAMLYGSDVDHIDTWVGGLSESHAPGAAMGELFATALADQFRRLRDGDRFYYRFDPDFSTDDLALLEATHLSDVIRRNTGFPRLQRNAFQVIPNPIVQYDRLDTALRLRLRWDTHPAATYVVEATESMNEESWSGIITPIDGNGAGFSLTLGTHFPEARFFRLRQYP